MEYFRESNGSVPDATSAFCKSMDWGWFYYSLIPAFGIIILFSFLEKRVRLKPEFCHGRPGIAYPVNLVDSYSDRWSHAFAFASMSTSIILLLLKDKIPDVDDTLNGTVQLFYLVGNALLVSFVFYPILLCLRKKRLLGNVLGFTYSVVWTVFYAGFLSCNFSSQNPGLAIAQIIADGSGLFCFLALILRFSVGMIREFIRLVGKKTENDIIVDGFKKSHYFKRVKFLFTPPLPEDALFTGNTVVRFVKRNLFRQVPGFRFPRRNICVLVLTLITTLQVSVLYMSGFSLIISTLFGKQAKDTFLISSILSLAITAIFLIDMQMRYRKHTVKLWRGDRSFCPEKKVRYDRMLTASLRFSGFQIGFTIWGFIVLQLLLWSLALIIVLEGNAVIRLIKTYWLSVVMTILLYYGQVIMCRYVFLQQASNQGESRGRWWDRQTNLGLDNRRLFHVVVYVTVFINVIVGFLSCFYRILKAILLGTIFIGRVDRCILTRGWEFWDQGYRSYIGFLQLEVAHTHPVVITFCHFLLQSLSKPRELFPDSSLNVESAHIIRGSVYERNITGVVSEDHTTKRASRLRRRWLVALTLKRNPGLALQRKRALLLKREESTRVNHFNSDELRAGCHSQGETDA